MLKIEFIKSLQGSTSENEDVVSQKGNYFWVIDGATDVYDIKTRLGIGVSDTMRIISKNIEASVDDNLSLKNILKKALSISKSEIEQNYPIHKFENYELPTFAMVFCRLKKNILEYLIFADCYLIYDGEKYFDNRFPKIVKDKVKSLGDVDISTRRKEVRKLANNGYTVGSLDAKGVYDAVFGELIVSVNESILLMSDGFFEYFDGSIEGTIKKRDEDMDFDDKYNKKDDASVILAKYIEN